MAYKVQLEKKAVKEIKRLPEPEKGRIKEALKELMNFPHGSDAKKLVGMKNKYRIRVGNYRILIELERDTLIVFGVLPRKTAYKRVG